MLKFFRQIRQSLLKENTSEQTSRSGRFSKYLFYAVGEILLVVIGILIALQVNNWNRERINRVSESQYYEQLLEDVHLDEELIEFHINATRERLLAANMILKELQKGKDMEKIAAYIRNAVSRSDFNLQPTLTTFEEIKSSGNLHLLRDLELKKRLYNHYAFMNSLMNTINNNASRLAARMLKKEDVIGTGLAHMTNRQNGFNDTIVKIENLLEQGKLSPENQIILRNDAVYYAALSSRNLEHLMVLRDKNKEMKGILLAKTNGPE